MTVHVSQTPDGAGASVSKMGLNKHLSDEEVREEGGEGWGWEGWDTASGTMD